MIGADALSTGGGIGAAGHAVIGADALSTGGGIAICLLLGVRHGLEPDHVAAIDGMTLRAADRNERHAAWIGALFAAGHCMVVLLLAAAMGLLAKAIVLPAAWLAASAWLPIGVLSLLGGLNLHALLSADHGAPYRPGSLRMRLMPARLRSATGMWSAVLVGVLFALVVDTLVHVSAWSAVATARGGAPAALAAAALFCIGLLVTSASGSQLLCWLLRRGQRPGGRSDEVDRYRRLVGWSVVVLSFGVALYLLAAQLQRA